MRRSDWCVTGTNPRDRNPKGAGRKRKHFPTGEKSAKQIANAASARVALSPERKDQLVEMLKEQLGTTYKKNSLTQYLDQLIARELEEAENPNLAQKRVLEGTLLEDLVCPSKRAPGKKLDGDITLSPIHMSPQHTPSLALTLLATGFMLAVVLWRR